MLRGVDEQGNETTVRAKHITKNTGTNWDAYNFEIETEIFREPNAIYEYFYNNNNVLTKQEKADLHNVPEDIEKAARIKMLENLKAEIGGSEGATLKAALASEKRIFVFLRSTQTEATQSVCTGIRMGDGLSLFKAIQNRYESKTKVGVAQKLRETLKMQMNEGELVDSFAARIAVNIQRMENGLLAQGITMMELVAMIALMDGLDDQDYGLTKEIANGDDTMTFKSAVLLYKQAQERHTQERTHGGWQVHSANKAKGSKVLTCNYCHGQGHDEEGCWKKYPDRMPQSEIQRREENKSREKERRANLARRGDSDSDESVTSYRSYTARSTTSRSSKAEPSKAESRHREW